MAFSTGMTVEAWVFLEPSVNVKPENIAEGSV